MNKTKESLVMEMAESLGYTIERNRSAIYLVKDGLKTYCKGFKRAYKFLYYRKKKKVA